MIRLINLKSQIFPVLVIVLICTLNSCNHKKVVINNTEETLHAIFQESEFSIKIEFWGCFGSSYHNLDVTKIDSVYKVVSIERKAETYVSKSIIDSLEYQCAELIFNDSMNINWCSVGVRYVIGERPNFIYIERHCGLSDPIASLLNYHELIFDLDSLDRMYDSLVRVEDTTFFSLD